MPRAQSSQPTIRKELKSNAQLQPTIRSNSAYSYDEARAGYVERPYGAGSQWEQLARSLGQWDNTLLPFLQNRLDAKIEREASEAQVKFENWDEHNKNRSDWKTFVEAHPEYQGSNPWARIGFEKARLKGLGLDVNKYLNDRFSRSELVNETDMGKVNNQLSEWLNEYRKETGLKAYSDKLFLAKHYSQMEGEAKANVLSRHTAQLAQNTQKRLEESYLSATSKEIDAAFNPSQNGGHSFSAPDRRDANIAALCDIIDRNAQDMARHGYLDTNIADFKEKAVFTAYYNNDEDIHILKAFDVLKQGKGVMSDLPGIREKIAQIKKQKRAEARANIQFAWAQDRRNKELEEERWTANSYTLASNTEFIATADSLRAQGCPERLVRPTLMNINSIRQETYKGLSYSPALMSHFAIAREMAKDGELNANAIIAQAPEFGPERTNQLLDDVREADKEENKAYREARKQAGQRVYTTYSNDDGDVLTKQMFKYLGGSFPLKSKRGWKRNATFLAFWTTSTRKLSERRAGTSARY